MIAWILILLGVLNPPKNNVSRPVNYRRKTREKRDLIESQERYCALGCDAELARAYARLDKMEREGRI